ncbi:hypothetical protein llap_22106 [Limosa lapponica baueri]|uniref:Uncharacterized protein n=1 Tax=Limosa lapponica baueri TaxID=1758121 RepID=A0A2I0T1C7_LIMLA|nr:hypothetical protein llap_22106 [Limosa lapponica baueri]
MVASGLWSSRSPERLPSPRKVPSGKLARRLWLRSRVASAPSPPKAPGARVASRLWVRSRVRSRGKRAKEPGGKWRRRLWERLREVAVAGGKSPTAVATDPRKRWTQRKSPGSRGGWMQLRKP